MAIILASVIFLVFVRVTSMMLSSVAIWFVEVSRKKSDPTMMELQSFIWLDTNAEVQSYMRLKQTHKSFHSVWVTLFIQYLVFRSRKVVWILLEVHLFKEVWFLRLETSNKIWGSSANWTNSINVGLMCGCTRSGTKVSPGVVARMRCGHHSLHHPSQLL